MIKKLHEEWEKLSQESQAMGAAMYAASNATQGGGDAGSTGGTTPPKDDVVDAEIVDEDPKK